MKSVIAASVLVFFMAGPAHAFFMQCKTYDRSDGQAPQLVRDYLEDSDGFFVRDCTMFGYPFYLGANNLARDGNICRYSLYELYISETGRPRLARMAKPPQTFMLVSESEACPSPGTGKFAATNHVPQDVFEHLVRLWHDAISSRASFVWRTFGAESDPAAKDELQEAISQGKSNRLAVVGVETRGDIGLCKIYEVRVADPDDSGRVYAVTVMSWLGRAYGIWHIGVVWY
jgi:hypothetical protein